MCILRTLARCLLTWLVFACGVCYGQGTAREHYSRGMEYAVQGDFAAAKKEFQAVLRLDTFDSDSSDSLAIVNDALEQKVTSATAAHLFSAIALRRKNLFDQAKSEFVKIIEANPNYAPAYYHRGLLYEKTGPHGAVFYDFDRALAINPQYAEAYYHRGLGYHNEARAVQMISSRIIRLDRADADFSHQSSQAREMERYLYYAISDYTAALKLNPNLREAYRDRAHCFYEIGQYRKAWDDVDKAERLGLKSDPRFLEMLRLAPLQ
jgi:tetratricopeptide (TPR) repeat protein